MSPANDASYRLEALDLEALMELKAEKGRRMTALLQRATDAQSARAIRSDLKAQAAYSSRISSEMYTRDAMGILNGDIGDDMLNALSASNIALLEEIEIVQGNPTVAPILGPTLQKLKR